jgi:ATP-dependent Clp protease ATP-binding subunit ClpA
LPRLSPSLETALEKALTLASEREHEYATLEHLLLALTEDEHAKEVMGACKVDIEVLTAELVRYIDDELTRRRGRQAHCGFQRVIQRAVIHVQSSGREEVTGANVLVAIFAERESHAAYFLQEQDMTRYDAVNFISHGIAKRPGHVETPAAPRGADEGSAEQAKTRSGKKKARRSTAYCVNLNEKARTARSIR